MKTHLSFRTNDLDASVFFYRTLLAAEPAKHYADYALFISDDPGLELALDRDPRAIVGENAHYGIVVSDPSAVDAAIARLEAAGIEPYVEREETCCYAKQTKVWSTDPDGRRWEVYAVLEESEQRDGEHSTCCKSEPERECCSGTTAESAA